MISWWVPECFSLNCAWKKFSITIIVLAYYRSPFIASYLHFLFSPSLLMLKCCVSAALQTEGQGPPCSTAPEAHLGHELMLDCKQGFCKHFNPANLHRASLTGMAAASKYCMVLAYNQRKTFMHASWLVNKSVNCLVIGQYLRCRHLPFVNRKCHTLAPPPTVTTHNPQTLGNAW